MTTVKDRPRIITNNPSLVDLLTPSSNHPITISPLDTNTPLTEFGKTANEKGCHIVVLDYSALPIAYRTEAGTSAILRAIHRANGMKIILVNCPDEKAVDRFVEANSISGYLPTQLSMTPTLLKSTILPAYDSFKHDHDSLTKLYIRRCFNERLEYALSDVKESEGSSVLSVTMFDIDHFKRINDTYGHDVGDLALQQFGRTLKKGYHRFERDLPARWGGEEFIVLSSDTELDQAYDLAQSVRQATELLSIPLPEHENPLKFTVSGGVVSYDGIDKEVTAADLLKNADRSLYRAKENGRNQICK